MARAVGFNHNQHLDTRIASRGFRQMSLITRLPPALGERLIEHFGTLQALFGASSLELQAVEGVGESRARVIRDGLVRLAESAYLERDGVAVSRAGSSAAAPAWRRPAELSRSRFPRRGISGRFLQSSASAVRSRPSTTRRPVSAGSFLVIDLIAVEQSLVLQIRSVPE